MSWETGYGDYLARPDWSTLRVIPWLDQTALVLADAVEEASGELVPVAPRAVLMRQIERCRALGLVPMTSIEFEYYLLDDSYSEARNKKYTDLNRAGWYSEDYHVFQGSKHEPVHGRIRNLMCEAGVPVEGSKGEDFGGQHEVNVHYADALESADRAVLLKHGAKEIAFQLGRSITFMAKPDQTWTGSSGHVHLSLWNEESSRNLFSAGGEAMSDTMRWFLGGLIANTRELALFFAPNVNSYKRFAAASWAPVNIIWARDNRTVGYRIVGRENALRIECRFPGGDANPYLSQAFLLAAGLAGIEQKIEPPGEFHGNGYLAEDCSKVPRALYEAIEEWRSSDLARKAFGEVVAAHYLNAAMVEQQAFDQAVTDWERERYFERG
jgi:glutamine synthetase